MSARKKPAANDEAGKRRLENAKVSDEIDALKAKSDADETEIRAGVQTIRNLQGELAQANYTIVNLLSAIEAHNAEAARHDRLRLAWETQIADGAHLIESLRASLAARADETSRLTLANAELGLKLQQAEAEAKNAQRRENTAIGEATQLRETNRRQDAKLREMRGIVSRMDGVEKRHVDTIFNLSLRLGEAEKHRFERLDQDAEEEGEADHQIDAILRRAQPAGHAE